MNVILDSLLKWFAPILSFTTEEIYKLLFDSSKSIHLEKFKTYPETFYNKTLNDRWMELIKIRNICNISIEEKRSLKEIGSSLEAELKIEINKKYKDMLHNIDFSELCITSKAEINYSDNEEAIVVTSKAKGSKCSICWKVKEFACERSSCPIKL